MTDTTCFHAPQAAEKYLKGFLAFHGQAAQPTHNLEELESACRAVVADWPARVVDVATLAPYEVEMRYDFEFWPDRTTAEEALRLAEEGARGGCVAVACRGTSTSGRQYQGVRQRVGPGCLSDLLSRLHTARRYLPQRRDQVIPQGRLVAR